MCLFFRIFAQIKQIEFKMSDFDPIDTPKGELNFIAEFQGNEEDIFKNQIDEHIPILPLRDMVIFPGTMIPVTIGRSFSKAVIKKCEREDRLLGVVTQKNSAVDVPTSQDFYKVGTLVKVVRSFTLPGSNNETVIVRAMNRLEIKQVIEGRNYYEAFVEGLKERDVNLNTTEFNTLMESIQHLAKETFKEQMPLDLKMIADGLSNKMLLLNNFCTYLPISIKEKIQLLSCSSVLERAYLFLTMMNEQVQKMDIMRRIENQTHMDLSRQQRDYFLNQEIRNIQRELNDGDDNADIAKLRKKAETSLMPSHIVESFENEIDKLARIPSGSPDYNTLLNYLETLISLPWGKVSEDRLSIPKAKQILDHDHFGLEKVKERILEQLAIVKLRGDMRSPILCLYGPPGVGKTSLGKSIAQAMGRQYVRMSLGGVSDEAEIRGHRRTYIGAMMGRILKNIQKAGTSNPVFVLDEIDKVSASNHGDPFSALLEVLDPEQNVSFHDNYLDLDYDLSKVMFIATANNVGNIPAPLRDRMEMIEVPGYLNEEKIEIAKRHLIPKIKEELGMEGVPTSAVTKSLIGKVIEQYTMESGVRALEKQLTKIYRKLGYKYLMEEETPKTLKESDLKDLLGVPMVTPEKYQGNNYAGVVTGLAWTSVGGTILMIEVSLSKGKGSKLTLTGSLGDVMKESAVLAVEYIKAHADYYGIDLKIFENWNIHIHVPDGATPKDGPSAGITLTTALISALTQRKVRKNLAMTGEITLRGRVTAVGGIREKILAAKRAGITDIILSDENKRHIEEIPERYINGMNFHYVKDIKEVISFAVLDEKVAEPIDFTVPETTKETEK